MITILTKIIMMMIMMMIPDLIRKCRHNSSVVDIKSGGKRNDHVKEHHQEDNTYNSSRRSDGGRVNNTGALIASRGDKTVSYGNHTTIHPSSYGNHDRWS
jgi:hypothetical protein